MWESGQLDKFDLRLYVFFSAKEARVDENGVSVNMYATHDEVETVAKFFKLLRIVKIARSVRIFKLARHFEGLQALGYTFKSKKNEFGLLLMFLTMGAFSFSSLIYLAEKDR